MGRSSHHWKVCALATLLATSVNASGWAQARKGEPVTKPKLEIERAERASGVIVKVKPIAKVDTDQAKHEESKESKGEKPRLFRLTINSNALWSDWARD